MADNVPGFATFMLNPQGHVVSWNDGARLLKGYTADEIIGHSFECFYSPEDVALGKPKAMLELAKQKGLHEDEGWRVRKDGSRFYADFKPKSEPCCWLTMSRQIFMF